MAASVIPTFGGVDVDMYLELLSSYFALNKTKDDCKVHALIMGLGSERYSVLRDLLFPRKPAEVPYHEVVEVLRGHYRQPRNRLAERAAFRELRRATGERIGDFVARLRGKAAHCEFGAQLTDNLLEQFQIGINCEPIRGRLLQLPRADQGDLGKVVQIAQEVEGQGLMADPQPIVQRVGTGSGAWKGRQKQQQPTKKGMDSAQVQCFACLRKGHMSSSPSCAARGRACRLCGNKGHFGGSRFCKQSSHRKADRTGASFGQSAQAVSDTPTGGLCSETAGKAMHDGCKGEPNQLTGTGMNLFTCTSSSAGQMPRCNLSLLGHATEFVIDTGACVNIIDTPTFQQMQDRVRLKGGTVKPLYAYGSSDALPVLGSFLCSVTCSRTSKEVQAEFHVFQGKSDCLLSYQTAKDLGLVSVKVGAVSKVHVGANVGSAEIVHQYPEVFTGIGRLKSFTAKLHTRDSVTPVSQPVRRLPLGYRAKVEQHIQQLVEADVIEPVEGVPSGWVSPLVCVPKESGEVRMTVDMRRVNEAIVRERHPIPTVRDMVANLEGAQVFSKLDLKQGFHQVELEEGSRDVTTFVSPFGLYRYKRLTMGLNAAPELFQYAIQKTLLGLEGVQNMADDLIVWGKDQKEHDGRLHALMQRLREVGVTLNPSKCSFGVSSVRFLGFIISDKGISPDPEKVKSILCFRDPDNQTDCRSFLGLVNFVGQFIPSLATLSEPIRRVSGKTQVFEWGPEQKEAFRNIKRCMSDCQTLAHFDPAAPTTVVADASPYGLGAVLSQTQLGVERVVAYGHRSLTSVERRYSQTERESLSLVWACEHFQHYLLGSTFTLVTDHKPLQHIFGSSNSKPVPRLERWALRLQSFAFKVVYRPGNTNVADPLSRLSVDPAVVHDGENVADEYIRFVAREAVPVALTWGEIKDASNTCPEMATIREAIGCGKFNKCAMSFQAMKAELSQCEGVVMRGSRIVIPQALRARVLELGHEGHMGMVKCKQRVRSKVWWPGIDRDVERMCARCDVCKRVSAPEAPAPLEMTKMPTKAWSFVAFDLLGPLPNGLSVAVLVDYYSRYVEAAFLRSTSAEKVVEFLDSVFSRQGYPEALRSDNGPQMVSGVWGAYMRECGIKWVSTTPLWAQANGLVERANRGLLKSLRVAHANKADLGEEMRRYLMAYRSTPHASTGVPPFTLLTGRQMRTKLPMVEREEDVSERARAEEADAVSKLKAKEYADARRRAVERDISIGDLVYLKQNRDHKLSPSFGATKYTVVAKSGTELTCQDEHGNTYRRNVSHAKKCGSNVDDVCSGRVLSEEDLSMNDSAHGVNEHERSTLRTPHERPDPAPAGDPLRSGDRERRPPAWMSDYTPH